MHDLMTAVNAQQSATTLGSSSSGFASSVSVAGYTNMSSVLNSLIAQLSGPSLDSSGSGTEQNSVIQTLQADFQQIVAASGGSATSPNTPSLASFLQNLELTINALGHTSPSSTGSLINVTA